MLANYQAQVAKAPKELEMWQRWNQGGRRPQDLEPLLKSLDNVIDREARMRSSGLGGSIPQAALKNELRNAAVKALETYDPSMNTKLTTHVKNNFMRTTGFIAANRNASGYAPKNRVDKYQYYMNAKNDLEQQLGREPTFEELAAAAPDISRNDLRRMQKEIRSEVFSGLGTEFEDGVSLDAAKSRLRLYRSRLTPQEQQVADALFSGQYRSSGQVAKALGLTPVQLSKLKASIERKTR